MENRIERRIYVYANENVNRIEGDGYGYRSEQIHGHFLFARLFMNERGRVVELFFLHFLLVFVVVVLHSLRRVGL